MKRLYTYMILASILVVASCQKPIGEKPAPEPGRETPAPKPGGDTPKAPVGEGGVKSAPKQWHVSTLAGSTDGHKDAKGTAAQFNGPHGIAVSPDGSALYVAELANEFIRKIALPSGDVTTFAGSTRGAKDASKGTAAQFNNPYGIAVSPDGSALYVADRGNHRIRKIALPLGGVTTVAGSTRGIKDATGTAAQFNGPRSIAVSPDGNTLYVADLSNNRIRKIALPSGDVTTVAGGTGGYADGIGIGARFDGLYGVAVSSDGNTLYVTDGSNYRIRKIDISSKKVETIAGSATQGDADGVIGTNRLYGPYGIAVASDGTLYVTDASHRIRKIEFK